MTDMNKLLEEAALLAAELPELSLRPAHAPNLPLLGAHRKHRAGQGDDFWQFDKYDPEKHELRDISWRHSAKTDNKLLVRQKEQQVTQAVYIWCDNGPDMQYSHKPGTHPTKFDEARVLALALTDKLGDSEEHVGYLGGSRGISRRLDSMVNSLEELTEQDPDAWLKLGLEGRTPLSHSGAIIISDFTADLDVIAEKLTWLAERKIQGHLLQVLDPAEINLPFEGRKEFYSASGASYELQSPEQLRRVYYDRLQARQKELADLAEAAGWTFSCHVTGQDRAKALLPVYEQVETALPAFESGLDTPMKNQEKNTAKPARKSFWPRLGF